MELPVGVIGPQGLAVGAHLAERGIDPEIFAAAPWAGATVARWALGRLLSPWGERTVLARERLLAELGWQRQDSPNGTPWVEDYAGECRAASPQRVLRSSRSAA